MFSAQTNGPRQPASDAFGLLTQPPLLSEHFGSKCEAYTQSGEFSTITRYADLAATLLVAASTYAFDDAGRLTSLTHTKGTTTLASYAWQFDASGRITHTTSPDGTTTFSYDANDQLTAADHSYQTDEAYEYDENGNRTLSGSATYTVGANNRITSDGTFTYLYDDEGNRTRRTSIATGDYIEYEWDHRNRLTAVEFRDSGDVKQKRIEYEYDAFNRLLRRRVDADGNGSFDSAQRFVYDAAPGKGGLSDIVFVFDDAGSLTHRFLPGPAIDQVFADENALAEVWWGLADHQNTVRDVAEHDAGTNTTSIVNHLQYDSFGNITSQTNSALQPLLAWTGRYRDPDTGLQWNLHRWYDPAVGRWLTEDPIGFAGRDTHLARYVGNSPTNATDPNGLEVDFANIGQAVVPGFWTLEVFGDDSPLRHKQTISYLIILSTNTLPREYKAWEELFGPDGAVQEKAKSMGKTISYKIIEVPNEEALLGRLEYEKKLNNSYDVVIFSSHSGWLDWPHNTVSFFGMTFKKAKPMHFDRHPRLPGLLRDITNERPIIEIHACLAGHDKDKLQKFATATQGIVLAPDGLSSWNIHQDPSPPDWPKWSWQRLLGEKQAPVIVPDPQAKTSGRWRYARP